MGEAIMAMQVRIGLIGVDVSKAWLDISDGETVIRIDNAHDSVRRYLRSLAGPIAIAIEATGGYDLLLVEAALASCHEVYLVNPYQLSKYREAIGIRAKTDESDARLLYRYLAAERDQLEPFRMAPKSVKSLLRLLRARGRVTQAKTQIALSLGEIRELGPSRRALLRKLDHTLNVIDRKLMRHLTAGGYTHAYRRCLTIPGIGPLNAVGLVATYHRGNFATVDAFIAYIGLDVRVRESGKFKGQRKLTKRGDREMRRLLFNAARTAARLPQWKDHYDRLRERGLSTTAASVALSRKLAKLAFALLRDQTTYRDPLAA